MYNSCQIFCTIIFNFQIVVYRPYPMTLGIHSHPKKSTQASLPKVEVVWFKRDLRISDHQPLIEACLHAQKKASLILPIYLIEPEIWQNPDASARHWQFINDCLIELNQELSALGQPLQVLQGSATDVFDNLLQQFQILTVWSHLETGNLASFKRDLAVKSLLKKQQVNWIEFQQHAVQRAGINRDFYSQLSQHFFAMQALPKPDKQDFWSNKIAVEDQQSICLTNLTNFTNLANSDNSAKLMKSSEITERMQNPYLDYSKPFNDHYSSLIQKGGRSQGIKLLQSFLEHRHRKYLANISKPLGGDLFSSRLSPHLAYGTLSIREVMQSSRDILKQNRSKAMQPFEMIDELDDNDSSVNQSARNRQTRGIQVFQQRLYWQSHFIQKLETEPAIEEHAMHPAYEDIRPWDKTAQQHFQAWSKGNTGFPMIDACMRCLLATGWLPFRMRALLVSFASYQLWIPWQKTAHHLAQLFTDYEPGIHYSQIQMQSGTTGINAIRIYNPIKQSIEHDANGAFIRKWCPELKSLDNTQIHTPWQQDLISETVDYPAPIIDLDKATQKAKDIVYSLKKQTDNKTLSKAVFLKHGSRSKNREQINSGQRNITKNNSRKTKKQTKNSLPEAQMSLF